MMNNNPKKQELCKFCHNLIDFKCYLKQNELYSPLQSATGREIKELKKGYVHKFLANGVSDTTGMTILIWRPIYICTVPILNIV